MKVVLCTPTRNHPHPAYVEALKASIPVFKDHGITVGHELEQCEQYISAGMATLCRNAMDKMPDAIVYLDDDMSWTPESLLKLIRSPEDVVGGTYRFKKDEVEYMGMLHADATGKPQGTFGGLLKAKWLPSGFLKLTAAAIDKFYKAFPELVYGPRYHPGIDLFNHGAHDGLWYGQDYAFCRNYAERCGPVWLMPNLDINHHAGDIVYPGNYHTYLRQQPGGDLSDCPVPPKTSLATLRDNLKAVPTEEVA
jgi:glycosyltransferase involved in cell wall biosynthesis